MTDFFGKSLLADLFRPIFLAEIELGRETELLGLTFLFDRYGQKGIGTFDQTF